MEPGWDTAQKKEEKKPHKKTPTTKEKEEKKTGRGVSYSEQKEKKSLGFFLKKKGLFKEIAF